jgi:F-type H+-transporting ATPase subunit alpha
MPFELQVMTIYAVTNGYIDDIPVERVREWEHGFHDFMRSQRSDVGDAIRRTKVIGDAEQLLIDAINAYKQTWTAQHSEAKAS